MRERTYDNDFFFRYNSAMEVDFRCPKCAKRYSLPESHSGSTIRCDGCSHSFEVPYPPLEIPDEVTSGGSTVYRHEARARDFEAAIGDNEIIEQIDAHITKHVGEVACVWHELISDLVHIDVHWVQPTQQRPWHTLITSGMSDRPMSPPEGAEHLAYTELMVCLPPDWPLSEEAFEDRRHYWPIEWLKYLARFPHEYETWLFDGHTIPNGDPAEPIDDSVDFIGWLVTIPDTVPPEFVELKISDEKTIYFLSILPLYQNEMDYKLRNGTEALMERYAKAGFSDIIVADRKDVTRRRWGLF